MLVHPDGYASYARHRPEELNHGVRWISRTPDQDALGMILPATAEPEGYTAEKKKGNIRTVQAGATVTFHYDAGLLKPDECAQMRDHIGAVLERA